MYMSAQPTGGEKNMTYTEKIFAKAHEEKGLYSVTVVENGISRTEEITPANKTNNCYSVAKAFTVTALGLLHDDGLLSTDERPTDIFKDELPEKISPKWEVITLDNVMRHRWGLENGFLDIDSEDLSTYKEKYGTRNDFLKIVFSADLPLTPGDEDSRTYSDAAYYLLSRVVTKKTGKTLFDFMRERLFTPLEFEEAAWSTCPMGYSMGATGLYLRTPDMAKLGMLYLNKGMYNGVRCLSEKWCDTVIERGYELRRNTPTSFSKGGMHGQQLFVDDTKGIVVAWLGYDTDGYVGRMFDFLAALE